MDEGETFTRVRPVPPGYRGLHIRVRFKLAPDQAALTVERVLREADLIRYPWYWAASITENEGAVELAVVFQRGAGEALVNALGTLFDHPQLKSVQMRFEALTEGDSLDDRHFTLDLSELHAMERGL